MVSLSFYQGLYEARDPCVDDAFEATRHSLCYIVFRTLERPIRAVPGAIAVHLQ
jgi:hypothetical protein